MPKAFCDNLIMFLMRATALEGLCGRFFIGLINFEEGH